MKLSELCPCDNCGKPIAPHFYVLRLTQAFLSPVKTNQVLGLAQMFQGHLGLAEIFAPDDEAVIVFGDKDPNLVTEIFLCQDCVMYQEVSIAQLWKRVNQKDES